MTISIPTVSGASLPALGSTNLVIDQPVGTQSGDWLFCFINISANTTITPPGDWTTDVNVSGVKAYRRQAGGSEPASYTFTRGLATNTIEGTIIRVVGADPTTPVQLSGGISAQTAGTGTTVVLPSLTTTAGFTTLVQIAHVHANTTFTEPGGVDELFDQVYASESFAGAVGIETVAVGPTGSRTWTAGLSGQRSGIMYAMQAVPPETGTFAGAYDFSGSGFTGQAGPGEGSFTGSYDFAGAFTGSAPAPPVSGNRWTAGGRDRFTARRTPKNRRRSR